MLTILFSFNSNGISLSVSHVSSSSSWTNHLGFPDPDSAVRALVKPCRSEVSKTSQSSRLWLWMRICSPWWHSSIPDLQKFFSLGLDSSRIASKYESTLRRFQCIGIVFGFNVSALMKSSPGHVLSPLAELIMKWIEMGISSGLAC